MADVEMAIDVQRITHEFNASAAEAEFRKYFDMDESRNKFIIVAWQSLIQQLDQCDIKIQDLEGNIQTLNEKSEKDDFKVSQLQAEGKTYVQKYRCLEAEASKLRDENKELMHCLNDDFVDDPFVAVVVDGDGAIFTDELLKNPVLAADKLKEAIRAQLREMPSLPTGIPIVVRMYANLQGLAKTIDANNIISHVQVLEFVSKFNFECDFFDFVDVGRTKEAADSKIRTIFNHYYKNKQCRRIFLAGITHDNGYQNVLKDFRKDEGDRITLVESYPAREEFKDFGLPITSFPGVFRTKMLPSHGASHLRRQSQPQVPLPPLQKIQDDNSNVTLLNKDNYPSPVDMESHMSKDVTVRELLKDKRRARIQYNRKHVRLDPALINPGGYLAKPKGGKNGYCNDRYLGGQCHRDQCDLEHDAELDAKDKDIMRYLARRRYRCIKGSKCVNFHCYMAHHCPFPKHNCRDGDCKSIHLEAGPDSEDRKPQYVRIQGYEQEIDLGEV